VGIDRTLARVSRVAHAIENSSTLEQHSIASFEEQAALAMGASRMRNCRRRVDSRYFLRPRGAPAGLGAIRVSPLASSEPEHRLL
jgi:hypothetical protein